MAPGLSYLLHGNLYLRHGARLFFSANISVSQLVREFLQEGIVKMVLAAKLSIWDITCMRECRQSE